MFIKYSLVQSNCFNVRALSIIFSTIAECIFYFKSFSLVVNNSVIISFKVVFTLVYHFFILGSTAFANFLGNKVLPLNCFNFLSKTVTGIFELFYYFIVIWE